MFINRLKIKQSVTVVLTRHRQNLTKFLINNTHAQEGGSVEINYMKSLGQTTKWLINAGLII